MCITFSTIFNNWDLVEYSTAQSRVQCAKSFPRTLESGMQNCPIWAKWSPVGAPPLNKINKQKLPVTHDTWHVTRDAWRVTRGGRWSFSQNFSSLALTAFWWFWGKRSGTEWINYLMSNKGVCRTAPVAPGLLNKVTYSVQYIVSVLGLNSEYTVKYRPPPEGVPEGKAQGNSGRLRAIFVRISRVES